MANKSQGEARWDQILQVSVTEDVKNSIAEIAERLGQSSSSVLRELINKALDSEKNFEKGGDKSQWLLQTESKLSDLKYLRDCKQISSEEYETLRKKALVLENN